MNVKTERRNIAMALPSTGEEEWQALREPIMSGWLTQGPKVAAFEEAFAKRHQIPHAFGVSSCTTGLHLALASLGVGPGDEVIVPAFTWIATANAVVYCGAMPVFADIQRDTYNIDPQQVSRLLTARTKAVVAVHLFGLCAEMDALYDVLPEGVAVVEDAACAAGSSYKGIPAGGLGDVAAFSFHPRKSITTGEGGMVTTKSSELAERIDRMRNHGAEISEEERHRGSRPYILPEFNLLGYNYRMTDLQGAVGLVQIGKLDTFVAERALWADYYWKQLGDISWLQLPIMPEAGTHALQTYVTYVDPESAPLPRNHLMALLQERGISTRPGTHAVTGLNYYRERFGCSQDDFPITRDCAVNTMAIPLHNRMEPEDYEYVARSLQEIAST